MTMTIYNITRIWHENTSKAGRRETVAERVDTGEALEVILNAEATNPEAVDRIRDYCVKDQDGYLYDFRDYTYRLAKA